MRRITFRDLVNLLQKDVEKYGDVLVKDFEIVGHYNELEDAIWDYDCVREMEEYIEEPAREINDNTTPCDYGPCPYDAEYSEHCRIYCGLGVDE